MKETKPTLKEGMTFLMGAYVGCGVKEEKGTHTASEVEVKLSQILFISES